MDYYIDSGLLVKEIKSSLKHVKLKHRYVYIFIENIARKVISIWTKW